MSSSKGPAEGTRIASGRYYLVRADGAKRVWVKLTKVKEGLPAFYLALSKAKADPCAPDLMPKLIADWQDEVMAKLAASNHPATKAKLVVVADVFKAFKAVDVQPPHIVTFLKPYRDRTRTHNIYRALFRELMRFSIEKGYRPPGSNPVTEIIPTLSEKARDRYITDSEVRRIKVAALRYRGKDGESLDTASGPMLCALIDMAHLTGQRIGDLLDLRWQADADEPDAAHLREAGIWFRPQKVRGKTRAAVLIEWTPRLRDVVRRLRELKLARPGASDWVFITQSGTPYTYWGASTAWRRAVKRAGIKDVTFHDLRAKALTDKEQAEGMQAARLMGSHTTETQTADYVRNKTARKTKATR